MAEDQDGSDGESSVDPASEVIMVPLADMLNAAAGLDNAGLHEDAQYFTMITTATIAGGSQIVSEDVA